MIDPLGLNKNDLYNKPDIKISDKPLGDPKKLCTHKSNTIIEVDPSGLRATELGAKLDGDKPDMDLVLGGFSKALIEVAKVGTAGAKKYSRNGWKSVPNGIKRYTSAELRHYFKEETEGPIDPDFGLLHSAHKAWNALAALELILEERNKKGQNKLDEEEELRITLEQKGDIL